MLVPAGIIWPCPRSISFIACRKSTGTGGNSRIPSLRTWSPMDLTMILCNWWERRVCEMHLGFVYKDSVSFNGVDIVGNEILMWARLSDFERVLTRMTYVSKDRILSHMWGEAKSVLQTVIGGNPNGVVFKFLLTYYFENGRVNQSISMG